MASKRFLSSLAKSIVSGSRNTSSSICATLFEVGEIYVETFLNPSYYLSDPSKKYFGGKKAWQPNRNVIQIGIRRLVDQGIVEKQGGKLSLTKNGRLAIFGYISKRKIMDKKWDGKYRLVIFDIPELKKGSRRWLREELYLLQYVQLQKSVFVGKYPLSQDIVKDIKKTGLSNFVNYLLVEKIFDKRKLKLFQSA